MPATQSNTFDMHSFTNNLLRRVALGPSPQPSQAVATPKPAVITPRETPLNPKPVEPSVLDWAAEWLHREVPAISYHDCKRLMLAVVTRRQMGRPLSVTETRWLQAWDHVLSEASAERVEEVTQ